MKAAILYILLAFSSFSQFVVGQDSTAVSYELRGSTFDQQGNWEEALRNWLKALSVYNKVGDIAGEAAMLDIIGNKYYKYGIYKKSAEYYKQKYRLYAPDNIRIMATSAELTALSYYYLPMDSLAAQWFNEAALNFERNGDTAGYLRSTEKLASVYIHQELYDNANEIYQTLLSVYNEKNDFKNIAMVKNQSGFLMFKNQDYYSALNDFQSAVVNSKKAGKDDFFLTDVYSNIAICFQNQGREKEMVRSFDDALQYAKSSGRVDEESRIERILALIYFNRGDNYHAELYCLNCIKSAKRSGNLNVLQLCYKDYSAVLEKGNDFVLALEYYSKHLSLRDSLSFNNMVKNKEITDMVAEYEATELRIKSKLTDEEIQDLEMKTLKAESARKENELKLLMKERELDRSEKDRLAQSLALEQEKMQLMENEQKVKSLEQQQEIQQLQLKQKDDEAIVLQKTKESLEKDNMLKETELKNEKFARKMAVWLGILMVLVAVIILFSLISSRKKNQRLAESKKQIEKINTDLEIKNDEVLEQNEKILQQKDIIELKNQSITDSIQYASRIQTAVLPPIDFIGEWNLDNFILFKPKDIVSGDFYWGVKKDDKIIVAAGDCTGHGVPGAFMSMLGHAFLEEIANTKNIENAASILNLLRDEVINALKQKGNVGEARDGMDISLIILDTKTGRLDFAGANNPIYLIRDNNLIKIQGDRMPIGIHFITFSPFTNQSIETIKGDHLYLFSDGYADQFGGQKGKKFMYKQFQNTLLSNNQKTMTMQKEILDNTFEKWKGDRDQIDDVLVIGMCL
ncbi:MAG TPA: SpoIIE family protein phosphatase [Bacteroidales bacterium]|nr:SpoIIE family protein phosphatase [Bacteroidales bacterium]